MDKLTNKKLLVAGILCLGVFSIASIVFLSSKLPMLSFDNNSQLAQIIAIETELLKNGRKTAHSKITSRTIRKEAMSFCCKECYRKIRWLIRRKK